MTIDLFDLNGSGIVFSDGYQQMLRAVKPFLTAVNAMGVFALPKRGVCVMTSEDSAYTLQTAHGADMEELYPHEVYFAGLLNAMGIAYQYCTDPGRLRSGRGRERSVFPEPDPGADRAPVCA